MLLQNYFILFNVRKSLNHLWILNGGLRLKLLITLILRSIKAGYSKLICCKVFSKLLTHSKQKGVCNF